MPLDPLGKKTNHPFKPLATIVTACSPVKDMVLAASELDGLEWQWPLGISRAPGSLIHTGLISTRYIEGKNAKQSKACDVIPAV